MADRSLLRSLAAEECPACSKKKRAMETFCRSCYFALPMEMRSALYRRFGEGYEEAVDAAVAWLKAQASSARQAPLAEDTGAKSPKQGKLL